MYDERGQPKVSIDPVRPRRPEPPSIGAIGDLGSCDWDEEGVCSLLAIYEFLVNIICFVRNPGNRVALRKRVTGLHIHVFNRLGLFGLPLLRWSIATPPLRSIVDRQRNFSSVGIVASGA